MKTEYARQLRKTSSFVERILWLQLRNRHFNGFKFRRQKPIGPYIVDFVCFEKRVILEMDGPHHIDQRRYDATRDAWLTNQGYRVLRMTNEEFLGNENMAIARLKEFILKA